MEIHSVASHHIEAQIERMKAESKTTKRVAEFTDPIREFSRASQIEGTVRGWLSYPIEERRRLIRNTFGFSPRNKGSVRDGVPPETEKAFKDRMLERWRALCVIIQEESRAEAGNRSPAVALAAVQHLFPEYNWKDVIKPAPEPVEGE